MKEERKPTKAKEGQIKNREDLIWNIEVKGSGKQFREIPSREANKLLSNLNENEWICYEVDTGKIVMKNCIPVRNIQNIYTILENNDKSQ